MPALCGQAPVAKVLGPFLAAGTSFWGGGLASCGLLALSWGPGSLRARGGQLAATSPGWLPRRAVCLTNGASFSPLAAHCEAWFFYHLPVPAGFSVSESQSWLCGHVLSQLTGRPPADLLGHMSGAPSCGPRSPRPTHHRLHSWDPAFPELESEAMWLWWSCQAGQGQSQVTRRGQCGGGGDRPAGQSE